MTKDRKSYVRFIVRRQDLDSRTWEGLFSLAYALRDEKLEEHEVEGLERALAWFRMHLKVPYVFAEAGNERAVCWFKATAQKPIGYARELVWLLREYGTPVEMIATDEPGTVIYEDRWQIVAKPRKEYRIRSK